MLGKSFETDKKDYLIRPRISALLADAVKSPLTIVQAGAGCGKTRAVFEFADMSAITTAWMSLSECDNAGSRFWTKYTQMISKWNEAFVEHCRDCGFPDTEDKINRHLTMRKRYTPKHKRLIVFDDMHLINCPNVLLFLERELRTNVKNTSVILICREMPDINLADLSLKGLIPNITEEDLNFTESELAQYLHQQSLSVTKQNQREIFEDTKGWAFSVNLAARSLIKSPGYKGYVRDAMKKNIFKLMQTEVFNNISERLRRFLARLSLIDHLSADLISELAGQNTDLISEMQCQNAYIRFDRYINAYQIHHLFLDFLRSNKNLLTQEEITDTYMIAARWCSMNGFEIDALNYFEKVSDYKSIVAALSAMPVQMPYDIALCAAGIFERAPNELADKIYFFAVMHVRVVIRLGRWQNAVTLMQRYESKFLLLPEDDPFRNRTLGSIYYSWGNISALMGTIVDRYDFDSHYAKMDECLTKSPLASDQYSDMPIGFWASLAGSPRQNSPQEYIESAVRSVNHISHCWNGSTLGLDILCRGELLYYQGDMKASELSITNALRQARENKLFEIEYKSLFYLLRLALWQGNLKKADQTMKDMESRLDEKSYCHRFINLDAAFAWYFCSIRQPEMISSWLKEKFVPYSHAYFAENMGNQIKARYCYLTREFPSLLAYIEGVKKREAILYGRIEMLAIEACVYFQMKERTAALNALKKAYETASPNEIIAPFIELGKDMRSLVCTAIREKDCGIPADWLEIIKRKSTTFAKHQSIMIAEYKRTRGHSSNIILSEREKEILSDLYNGLSRPEISVKHSLSINTVNSVANNIFDKLGAHGIVDVVRIAAEERLV
ncbi:MAG: LuxR C-terminal-related transcriptional regulator [Eubacterium sp.]|jgi:LuxR family maltose regulon positive regulatory protein|nr:LuxR C-terminal-related transcriptional regulator [Eubacterium sp.]